jgi:hypothetical protein
MRPVKTDVGHQVLKDRSVPLTPRQRAAFILIDGKRTASEVLQQTAAAGVTREDLEHLLALGLIARPEAPVEAEPPAQPADTRTPKERYAAAYPVASQLTAGLGLRGLRLNLAVEKAGSLEDLLALAPKIREAVGADKFAPLERAIRGPAAAASKT